MFSMRPTNFKSKNNKMSLRIIKPGFRNNQKIKNKQNKIEYRILHHSITKNINLKRNKIIKNYKKIN